MCLKLPICPSMCSTLHLHKVFVIMHVPIQTHSAARSLDLWSFDPTWNCVMMFSHPYETDVCSLHQNLVVQWYISCLLIFHTGLSLQWGLQVYGPGGSSSLKMVYDSEYTYDVKIRTWIRELCYRMSLIWQCCALTDMRLVVGHIQYSPTVSVSHWTLGVGSFGSMFKVSNPSYSLAQSHGITRPWHAKPTL